jgi:Flp pilus assembly protein protease CpaA
MDDSPPPVSPATLKFLARLVTVLTATMIIGVLVITGLLVTRLQQTDTTAQALPDTITLPEGATARAVTVGVDWYAVVTSNDRILIFDRPSGDLRQTVTIETGQRANVD